MQEHLHEDEVEAPPGMEEEAVVRADQADAALENRSIPSISPTVPGTEEPPAQDPTQPAGPAAEQEAQARCEDLNSHLASEVKGGLPPVAAPSSAPMTSNASADQSAEAPETAVEAKTEVPTGAAAANQQPVTDAPAEKTQTPTAQDGGQDTTQVVVAASQPASTAPNAATSSAPAVAGAVTPSAPAAPPAQADHAAWAAYYAAASAAAAYSYSYYPGYDPYTAAAYSAYSAYNPYGAYAGYGYGYGYDYTAAAGNAYDHTAAAAAAAAVPSSQETAATSALATAAKAAEAQHAAAAARKAAAETIKKEADAGKSAAETKPLVVQTIPLPVEQKVDVGEASAEPNGSTDGAVSEPADVAPPPVSSAGPTQEELMALLQEKLRNMPPPTTEMAEKEKEQAPRKAPAVPTLKGARLAVAPPAALPRTSSATGSYGSKPGAASGAAATPDSPNKKNKAGQKPLFLPPTALAQPPKPYVPPPPRRSLSRGRSQDSRPPSRGRSLSPRGRRRSFSRSRSRSRSYSRSYSRSRSRRRSRSFSSRSRSRSYSRSRSPRRGRSGERPFRGGYRGRGGRGGYEYGGRGGYRGRGGFYDGGRGGYYEGRGRGGFRGRGYERGGPPGPYFRGRGRFPHPGRYRGEPERWPMDDDGPGRSRSISRGTPRSMSRSRSPSRSRSRSMSRSRSPPPRTSAEAAMPQAPGVPGGRPLFPAAEQAAQAQPESKLPPHVREAAAAALQRQLAREGEGDGREHTPERMRERGVSVEGRGRGQQFRGRPREPESDSERDDQENRSLQQPQGGKAHQKRNGAKEPTQQQPPAEGGSGKAEAVVTERYMPESAGPELAGFNPDDYDWDAFFNEDTEVRKRGKKEKKRKKEKEHRSKRHKKEKRKRSRSPPLSRSRSRSPAAKRRGRLVDRRHRRSASPYGRSSSPRDPSVDPALTRPFRRIYVGGLPEGITQEELREFVGSCMVAAKAAAPAQERGPVTTACFINQIKRFAFVELRSCEEAANALALNGILLGGNSLQVRRPSDFNQEEASRYGPTEPADYVDMAAVEAMRKAEGGAAAAAAAAAAAVPQGPDAVYVSGIPMIMTDVQVREIMRAFGTLKQFIPSPLQHAVVCQYADQAATDKAVTGITAMAMAGSTLRISLPSKDVQAAAACASVGLPSANPAKPAPPTPPPESTTKAETAGGAQSGGAAAATAAGGASPGVGSGGTGATPQQQQQQQQQQQGGDGGEGAAAPTCVLRLSNMLSREELADPEEYSDIVDDIASEIESYGKVKAIEVPQPATNPADDPPGVGLVFVLFEEAAAAQQAQAALDGRTFADNVVAATYYDEQRFAQRQFA